LTSRSQQIGLGRAACEQLVGRRLIEAGEYVDGEPILILVFADRLDQENLDRERGDRVRWAVSTHEDWLLLSDERVIARRGDSDQMDVPGFRPIIGRGLAACDVREQDFMLSLTFTDGYSLVVLSPSANHLDEEPVQRWSITTPAGVTTLVGGRIVVED
jgi:hypothetical protein